MPPPSNDTLLMVRDLLLSFPANGQYTDVLQGVSLTLYRGEILGLVGESGSGKSILARALLRLETPAVIRRGSILLDGVDLCTRTQRQMQAFRGKRITLVLQDPRRALDPVYTMASQLREVSLTRDGRRRTDKTHFWTRIMELLKTVGIADARRRCRQYPHAWSRGMLQRGQLVMAFATPAEVLILDEVTSALDPTVCLQVLDAIVRLKEKRNAGILLITHDLCLAAEICDRVAVMQKGRIVESGPTPTIFDHPAHPYTQLLVTGMNADSGSEERVNNR